MFWLIYEAIGPILAGFKIPIADIKNKFDYFDFR